MRKDLIRVSTSGMTREEWLEERRKGIGGSDAGAILGLNPWTTPTNVYYDKIGSLHQEEETEAIRIGRDLEPYVASRFEELTGKTVRRTNYLLKTPDHPFLIANVDRLIVGEDAGLECKTASAYKAKIYRGGEFPESYYCQTVHYLSVTGAKRWYLASLILGVGFKVFMMTTDPDDKLPPFAESMVYVSPDEIEALREAEITFWNEYVLKETPPPVDGLPTTTEAIETSIDYDACTDDTADLASCITDLDRYFELKAQIESLEQQAESIRQRVMQSMAECTKGLCAGYSISYKPQQRSTFDRKLYQKDHPDIDLSPYFKTSSTRPLRIQRTASTEE